MPSVVSDGPTKRFLGPGLKERCIACCKKADTAQKPLLTYEKVWATLHGFAHPEEN